MSKKNSAYIYLQWKHPLPDIFSLKKDALKEVGGNKGGRPSKPHITVIYGIEDHVTPEEIQGVLDLFHLTSIEVLLRQTMVFNEEREGETWDAVVLSVESEELEELNFHLAYYLSIDREGNMTVPDLYTPHMTLGYVHPGRGEEFERMQLATGIPNSEKFNTLYYSDREGKVTQLFFPE